MAYKLGLDTGGTYTDAVIVDEQSRVCAHAKSLTTHQDLSLGLRDAIQSVIHRDFVPINLVSLSTTLATNALVEGRGKSVGLILIGYEEKQLSRARLKEALAGDPMILVAGGHDANGNEENPLDLKALSTGVENMSSSVQSFAISAMFATRNPAHEIAAREWVREKTGLPVTCGHELSSALDAPRRALTAVLNARLIPLIKSLLDATSSILDEHEISAPLMIVKGDGSLVSRPFAENSPVETILSGPAASVVGAQFMSQQENIVVSDMGGTTTDVALLFNGRPKLDPEGATVGGWRTMVQAVKINTCGLGGDSAIRFDREQRRISVGPDRVKSLSLLASEYPEILSTLNKQLDQPYVPTHAGQFALANTLERDISGLSKQQKELWDRIKKGPVALVDLFEDQTLERALDRLINRGIVLLSGFTPTDASHVLGIQTDWNADAARIGAELLMSYSEFNLGQVFDNVQTYARHVHEEVARRTSIVLLESVLADHSEKSGLTLPHGEKALIDKTFESDPSMPVALQVTLKRSLMGIGAPASTYYPRVGELLNTDVVLPEYASVANALGAVVGTVRQSQSVTITPAGGKRVKAHLIEGVREFDDLETAAKWVTDELSDSLKTRMLDAGAANYELETDRYDNIVDSDGDRVFFESTITVSASGRPSTA